MTYDRDIYKAIKGTSENNPQNLVNILGLVDSQQKLLLTHEELSGGLRRLIENGLIAEASPLHYFDTAGIPHSSKFSGLSPEEHASACHEYIQEFNSLQNDETDEYDFTRLELTIRWKIPDNKYPTDDDEDAAEAFASKIEPIVCAYQRGDLNGFMYGKGYIDILIFTREKGDADIIYANIVDTFSAFGCPPGSCIIRKYDNTSAEIISDVISG
jgi:hypothetical protein